MNDERFPNHLFYSQLHSGKQLQHKPRKPYKDRMESNLQLEDQHWEVLPLMSDKWRGYLKEGWRTFEENGLDHKKTYTPALKRPYYGR